MPSEYASFRLAGHHFLAMMPSNSTEPRVWTLVIVKGPDEIRREEIPMLYEPRFGPDVGDVRDLNDRIEAIIKELGLEESDNGHTP